MPGPGGFRRASTVGGRRTAAPDPLVVRVSDTHDPSSLRGFLRDADTWVAGVLIAALFVLVLIDIGARNFLGTSLIWPEEISRILSVWSVFIGAAAALKSNALISIDVVYRYLGARGRRAFDVVAFVVVAACLAFLFAYGIVFFARFGRDLTPTTGIPKGWFYGAVPVGSVLMFARLAQWFRRRLRQAPAGGGGVAV